MRRPRTPRLQPDRHASRAAEMAAWSMTFRSGHDFFCDAVRMFNYAAPERIPRADIEAAWKLYGADFMAQWTPEPKGKGRQQPWALTEFGPPP